MLKMVNRLRLLLRKAFLVTNRVNVIGLLQGSPEPTPAGESSQCEQNRGSALPQTTMPKRSFCMPSITPAGSNMPIVSLDAVCHKWRSSSQADDKCHISTYLLIRTSPIRRKLRIEPRRQPRLHHPKRPSSAEGPYKAGTEASFNRR